MRKYVEVDGQKIFTADFTFEQVQAQSRRIDRAKNFAVLALTISFTTLIVVAVIALAN